MVERNDDNDVVLDTETLPEDIEIEAGEEEALASEKMKALREKLAVCEEERRKSLEDLSRARADFLNGKKRNEEQLIRDRERITERHIEDLLPLADSFEMAMNDPTWTQADPKWQAGVSGIHTQLMNIFKNYGVEVINPLGKEFNPHEHEALMDTGNGNTVSTVIQSGYKIGDRVLRPAKVAVGGA
jgi:molecular chaperone GrpE